MKLSDALTLRRGSSGLYLDRFVLGDALGTCLTHAIRSRIGSGRRPRKVDILTFVMLVSLIGFYGFLKIPQEYTTFPGTMQI